MKKEYQNPVTFAIEMRAMGFLMASMDQAGGDPQTPPGFAPRHRTAPF